MELDSIKLEFIVGVQLCECFDRRDEDSEENHQEGPKEQKWVIGKTIKL